jgi:hypothetical protein
VQRTRPIQPQVAHLPFNAAPPLGKAEPAVAIDISAVSTTTMAMVATAKPSTRRKANAELTALRPAIFAIFEQAARSARMPAPNG